MSYVFMNVVNSDTSPPNVSHLNLGGWCCRRALELCSFCCCMVAAHVDIIMAYISSCCVLCDLLLSPICAFVLCCCCDGGCVAFVGCLSAVAYAGNVSPVPSMCIFRRSAYDRLVGATSGCGSLCWCLAGSVILSLLVLTRCSSNHSWPWPLCTDLPYGVTGAIRTVSLSCGWLSYDSGMSAALICCVCCCS